MGRRLVAISLAGAAAGIATLVVAVLPPETRATERPEWSPAGTTVRGAYHVHSVRSDGSGTVDEIAAAAARAGLQFVILTDHGDGTRPPDPPRYRSGVVCIDAVEISTTGGHYVALGMSEAPYPLGGAPGAAIEDVRRLGGVGIAAHPGSARPSLGWQAWEAPFDGLEWLNADSEWRDESWRSLGRTLLTYTFRPPETLTSLLDRPDDVLARWDAVGLARRVPALAGADAHARMGLPQRSDPDAARWRLRMPGYESSFRAFSNTVLLDRALTGDAGLDAKAILEAISQGRTFTTIDGLAGPGGLEFVGTSGGQVARLGDDLAIGGPATLRARIAAPQGTTLVLLRNGAPVGETRAADLAFDATGLPGVYRIEARVAGGPGDPPIPWIVSNPIYVGLRRQAPEPIPDSPRHSRVQAAAERAGGESSSASASEVQVSAPPGMPEIRWRFALAPGIPSGQFAAVRVPVPGGLADFDRVEVTVRADRPVRAWLQLRAPGGSGGERWGHSFYADPAVRQVDLRFADFQPIGVTTRAAARLDQVDSILVVVDTVNTRPGSGGSMTISDISLVR